VDEYDVVIVGTRCAGASLAIRLARTGLRVCALDRARFPSDVPSTHGIQPSGVAILRELGCYDDLAALTDPIRHATVLVEDARIEVDDADALLGAPMLNLRRDALDATMIDAAARAGAEVRTRTTVTGLRHDDRDRPRRVTGVETSTGALHARVVVGADGARSTVARLVEASDYCPTSAGRIFLWGYFRDTTHPAGHVWLGRTGGHGFLASPTDDGLFMAVVAASQEHRKEVLADRERAFARGLRDWPELEAMVAPGRREGPLHTMPHWPCFFRRSAGQGWALVGDAGHAKDPTPGQGIADALRQTTALASAIVSGLESGGEDLDEALHRWWSWRDRDAWQMYWLARDLGADGPVPLLIQQIMTRIAADPERSRQLLRVLNHDLPPDRLFTAPLALGALGRALRRHPGERGRLLREARGLAGENLRHLRRPRLARGA
jgi:2-polyprenyl-6-methoxyphenol hydroxylase-like FAD-dependent oxidoreductase